MIKYNLMNSPSIVNVLIEERDVYFRVGLKFNLRVFFNKNKQDVIYDPSEQIDLLIRSEKIPVLKKGSVEIIISDRKKGKCIHRECTCKNIFFKHDTAERFTLLLEKILKEKESKKTCIVCRGKLTRREKQILNKFSEGLSASEIAKNIGLHVKSVSQHKRNSMRKLSLRNTKELLIWLMYNKINIDI